jgi:hypothetical protein
VRASFVALLARSARAGFPEAPRGAREGAVGGRGKVEVLTEKREQALEAFRGR